MGESKDETSEETDVVIINSSDIALIKASIYFILNNRNTHTYIYVCVHRHNFNVVYLDYFLVSNFRKKLLL